MDHGQYRASERHRRNQAGKDAVLCSLFEQWERYNVVIYYLLLLLTDRPIVAPAIDDIIGKERNYGKPIPRQYLFGQTSGDDHVLWIKNDLRRMDIP